MGVSLNPKDQVKGGLIQDVDATLTSIRFKEYTYPSGQITIAAVGALTLDAGDEYEQVWSVGSPEEWEIEDDGEMVGNRNGKTGINDNSNFGMFARELEPAGFPMNKLDSKISILDGLKAHWIRKAQPKRAGLQGADERERTTLVPEKIIKLPWEKDKATATKGKTTTTASKPATGAAPASASSNGVGDLENEAAVGIASEVLAALKASAAGGHAKTQWGLKVLSGCSANDSFKALPQGAADRTAVQRLLKNAEFLATQEVEMSDKGDVIVPA